MASGTLEKCSLSWMNAGYHCTGQMADSMYGVVWVSGLLMSNIVDRVAHGGGGVME